MRAGTKIVEVARTFCGLYEIVSNAKWSGKTSTAKAQAKVLEKVLYRAGHEPGWSYCMSFAEGVWVASYTALGAGDERIQMVSRMLNPSVMQSWQRVKDLGLDKPNPVAGAIFFMQNGSTGYGHAGIVESILDREYIATIEGNTSPSPRDVQDDRDGGVGTGGIWQRKRPLVLRPHGVGLHLLGYLHPIEN